MQLGQSFSKFVTQAHRKAGRFHVHREWLGQLIFQPGFIGLELTKLGHKAQVIGDGLFEPNKALECDGVFRELPDIKVGVAA